MTQDNCSKNMIKKYLGLMKNFLERRLICLLIFIFGFIIYLQLMTQQLVNTYDGLWEFTYHSAGKWELSLGRWFWLYLDKIRFGFSNDPWTSVITIFLFTAGMILIADIFALDKKISFLSGALFISSTAVCVSLSYRYMSPVFGFAFFSSILAAWIIIKSEGAILSVAVGGFVIALSMGSYQSCIGCTCLVIAGVLLWKIYCTDISWKQIGLYVGKSISTLLSGGIFYVLLLKAHLYIFNTNLSSYNGANTYSLWNTIKKLPVTIKNTYIMFSIYFFKDQYKTNMFQGNKIYWFLFVLAGIFLFMGFIHIWGKSPLRAICYIFIILLLPVLTNAVVLIATDVGISIQMTVPLALFISILICIISKIEFHFPFLVKTLGGLAILITLWGNIYQVQVDQNAMYEGKTASSFMAQEIVHDLSREECLNSDLRYCIIGIPAGNKLFYVSETYGLSNNYARVGAGWTDAESTMKSWRGIFHNFCGINLNIWSSESCKDEVEEANIENMPVYPEYGYIKQVGDVIVIKVN